MSLTITLSTPAPCNAVNTAPTLSQATACITGTYNLTSISASNTPAGTVLAWFSGSTPSAANAIASPTNVTSGTYYAAFYDAVNNCYSPTSSVTLNPNPVASFSSVEACLGLPTQFNENSTVSTGSIAKCPWDFGDQGSSTQQNPSPSYAAQKT